MIRIRGRIGDWPVDLEIELDAQDWMNLTRSVGTDEAAAGGVPAPATAPGDALWHSARDCSPNWKRLPAMRCWPSGCWCACVTVTR